jgi:Predicted transcriptional regulators
MAVERLTGLQQRILEHAIDIARRHERFYGYELAQLLGGGELSAALLGHGTLYKALAQLEDRGYLTSSWERQNKATRGRRPLRRLYRITASGESALVILVSATGRGATAGVSA